MKKIPEKAEKPTLNNLRQRTDIQNKYTYYQLEGDRRMLDVQKRILELMKEIDGICQKNDIRYFLQGRTALMALKYGGFKDCFINLSIGMTVENAKAFLKVLESDCPSGRYYECMFNSPNYPRVSIRYGDRNSMDFATYNYGNYKYYGINVVIEIYRHPEISKLKAKVNGFMEYGWEYMCNPKKFTVKSAVCGMGTGALAALTGRRKFSKRLFKKLVIDNRLKTDRYMWLPYYGKGRKYFTADMLNDTRRIPFEDTEFPVIAQTEEYLKLILGKKWEERKFPERYPSTAIRLIDTNLPFQKYLSYLKTEKIDAAGIWKKRKKFVKKNNKVKVLDVRLRGYWPRIFMSGDRYIYWNYYNKKKYYLNELYKSGEKELLASELEPCIELMEYYEKRDLGFYFDEKIFEMIEYVLEGDEEKSGLPQKILKHVPEGHLNPLKIRDYRGREIKVVNETGLRPASEDVVDALLIYLKRHVGNCIYLYIDLAKYGLDNPNMKIWYDTKGDNINLVVMKYYDSFQVYSESDDWDTEAVKKLLANYDVGMISGKEEIIEKIYPDFKDQYELEIGYVFQLTDFREFDEIVKIERVEDPEEFPAIARFICSNESIGGYYDPDNLAEQLRERMESGMGRDLVIRGEDGLLGHIATYAEYDNYAVTAGLLSVQDGTNIPYGSMLESRLVHDLLSEGFTIFTFVTEKRRAKFFKLMGCKQYGRYGKMTKSR